MAVLSGSNIQVFEHSTSTGPMFDSSGKQIWTCKLVCEFSGTYAQSDNAAVAAVTTVIADSLKSGDTIALLDASFAQAGIEGTSTAIGAKTVAVSGTGLTLELTGADMSTEHANAALGTMVRPLCFSITYTRA
jgi:hypothetical protein